MAGDKMKRILIVEDELDIEELLAAYDQVTREDLLTQGKIENQGYLDNYVMYDRQLRPMESLARRCRRYFPL